MNNPRNIFSDFTLKKYVLKDVSVDKFRDELISYFTKYMKKF